MTPRRYDLTALAAVREVRVAQRSAAERRLADAETQLRALEQENERLRLDRESQMAAWRGLHVGGRLDMLAARAWAAAVEASELEIAALSGRIEAQQAARAAEAASLRAALQKEKAAADLVTEARRRRARDRDAAQLARLEERSAQERWS